MPAAQYRDRNKLGVTLELRRRPAARSSASSCGTRLVTENSASVRGATRPGLRRLRPSTGARLRLDHRVGQTGPYGPSGATTFRAGDQRVHDHHRLSRRAADRSGQSISDTMPACSAPSASLRPALPAGTGKDSASTWPSSQFLVALDNLGGATRWAARSSPEPQRLLRRLGHRDLRDDRRPRGRRRLASNAVWARFARSSAGTTDPRPEFATAAARRDRRDAIAAIIRSGRRAWESESSAASPPPVCPPRRSQRGRDGGRSPGRPARCSSSASSRLGPLRTTGRRSSSRRLPARSAGSPPAGETTRRCSAVSSATRRGARALARRGVI